MPCVSPVEPIRPDYPGCPATVTAALADGQPLREPRWGLVDVVIAFVAQVVAVAVVGGGLTAAGMPMAVIVIVSTVAGWAALLGWTFVATRRRGNGVIVDLGVRLSRADIRIGAIAGLLVLAVGVAAGLLTSAITGSVNSAAGDVLAGFIDAQDRTAVIVFLIMVALLAPIAEELFVRGLMFGALRKRGISVAWTIVITTVAFAVMHLEPVRLPMIVAMGAVLGIVRARTGSVGASMVAHGVNNGLQVMAVVVALAGGTIGA